MSIHLRPSTFRRAANLNLVLMLAIAPGGAPMAWGESLDFAPPRPEGPAKIQSSLWDLAAMGQAAAKPGARAWEPVVVTLVPYVGKGSASIDTSSMAALGVKVLARSKSLMRVAAPSPSLLAVSELPGVRFVRKPIRPHAQEETWSEGGWRIKAYENLQEGLTGQGVKVAVIDGGFGGARGLRGGEMPQRWEDHDFTGEGIYTSDESVHGTGCAEIVHDMAQAAELWLLKVGDLIDLENAKDLCIREEIDIINHSIGWFGTGIGDGRGMACDIADDAAEKGILWVNSAGNDAKSHYYGFWSDFDSDGWQNFSNEDEVLAFEAEKGDEISIFLTWNDWPNSRENYDLYLSSVDSSGNLEVVAESTDRQDVTGGDPVESIEYEAERAGEYGISVRSEDARSKRLKIWSLNHDFEEYSVAENSIGSPADARGAMSVGAVYHGEYGRGTVADYSSRGPTTDGRIKPELVAPTGVSTVSYGRVAAPGDGYHGTSAAAPHVAGAAALIKQANPSYSRTELWDALIAATVPMDASGPNNNTGHGKLVLPIMQVPASPRITSISAEQVRYNEVVTVGGINFGSSRGSSSVRIGAAVVTSFTDWSNTTISFRVPANARSGDLTVRTSEGMSNAVPLEITNPYLERVSPSRVKPGERLTLTGANFRAARGSGYVLFSPDVRPSSGDYVSWSDGRVVVKVPAGARSGSVRVVTSGGSSTTRRITVEELDKPRITSVSPSRVRYNAVLTIRGTGFGATRGTSRVIFHQDQAPRSYQYTSWSDNRIQVRVPTGARTGNLQVVTATGSHTFRVTITSPWVGTISPRSGRANTYVTVTGSNFGSSRGSSSVRIGSAVIPSVSTWSDSRIRFRIPVNSRSGNVSVRTSQGTSNTLFLEVTSPYLSRVSPARVEAGDRLTLSGANFRPTRGSGYVLFTPNVRPSSGDYVTWTDRRIVVEVPSRARSGNVKVVTVRGSSGTKRIEVEGEALEPLPSRGIFGYDPPTVTSNPKTIMFGFEGIGEDVVMTWTAKSEAAVDILVNDQSHGRLPAGDDYDWRVWWIMLERTDLNSGRNVIEFRNRTNQYRTSSFTRWQLKDVRLWKPFNAKLAAGATYLGPSRPAVETGLGESFPTPFNAEVTVPFTTDAPGPVRLSVYNLMGQQVRVLHDGWMEAGAHQARWDGRVDSGAEAATGLYWALLQTEGFTQSVRLVLIR